MYCCCSVLICKLEIHETIILKKNEFSHGRGTDTFLRFLPNHSIDHHKWFTINMSFESWLGHWRRLEVPRWGLSSWSLFGYFHWSLLHPCSELWLDVLILKVQKTFKSFKSYFWALEDIVGSWLGFGIFILIWIWSLVFDTLMFHIFALSWFWRCKEPPCHLSLDLGLWRTPEVPD